MRSFVERLSSLEEDLAASRAAPERLEEELAALSRSHADLQQQLDALEKSHTATVEIKASLEKTLGEKVERVSALEQAVAEAEKHSGEVGTLLKREENLKQQLQDTQTSLAASKDHASALQVELRNMKTTLSAASHGLEERDGVIRSLKEKLSAAEAEQVKASELLKEKVVAMNKIKVWFLTCPFSDTRSASE